MIEEKLKNWKKELKKISLDTTFRGDSSSIFVKGPYIVGYDEYSDLSFRISNSTDGFNFFIERSGSTMIDSNIDIEKSDKVFIIYKNILKDIIDFERSISNKIEHFPNLPKKDERDILISEILKEIKENL
jgi:hypothetical protein